MNPKLNRATNWLAAGIGVAAGAYAAYVGATWLGYGKAKASSREDGDALLDVFMPEYEVVDRHAIRIHAPAAITFSTASNMRLMNGAIVRGIFKVRELFMGGIPYDATQQQGLLDETRALGWRVLAEQPGREIVMGAVTKPWEANPVFRGLPPAEFAAFNEPNYVKIAWTLRADPWGDSETVFRTETRVIATDSEARKKFRLYWSLLSPGILVIRRALLPAVKRRAENRWRQAVDELPAADSLGRKTGGPIQTT